MRAGNGEWRFGNGWERAAKVDAARINRAKFIRVTRAFSIPHFRFSTPVSEGDL